MKGASLAAAVRSQLKILRTKELKFLSLETLKRTKKMKNLVEKLPDQQPALRVMAMPPDTNQYGDVFGGWIMSQVDLAGSSIASRVANSRTATVAVTSFTFKEPVWVGDVVSFYATVLKVGTTSITEDVTVLAERLHKDNHRIVKVTEAQLVFVALNKDGRPQPVYRADNPAPEKTE